MICNDHAPGKSMGATLATIWRRDFAWLRDGDFYVYQNIFKYSPELRTHGPLLQIISGPGPKLRDVSIYNTDIKSSNFPDDG